MNKRTINLPPPLLVNTPDAMEEMLYRLLAAPAVAVDTESNSLYVYAERVCLIQFSVPGQDYLVDPLAIEDLSPLGPIFADPDVEKILHAAEYDVMGLRRDYGFDFAHLFDTMIASRIVGWPRYGLASLLEEHFGVQTDKRLQRTNWGYRPLSDEQIEYARLDTHFLLSLHDILCAELDAQGRMVEAQQAFDRVAESEWGKKEFDPEGYWTIRGVRELEPQQLAVLRELYLYREERAQQLDRPPFKVLQDSVLISLSREAPRSFGELGRIVGLPHRLPPQERRQLLELIEYGLHADPPLRQGRADVRPDDESLERYEALRTWRKERAEARGVEPDVILSNRALRVLSQRNPRSPEELEQVNALNDWERQTYGREIVSLLRRQARLGAY